MSDRYSSQEILLLSYRCFLTRGLEYPNEENHSLLLVYLIFCISNHVGQTELTTPSFLPHLSYGSVRQHSNNKK